MKDRLYIKCLQKPQTMMGVFECHIQRYTPGCRSGGRSCTCWTSRRTAASGGCRLSAPPASRTMGSCLHTFSSRRSAGSSKRCQLCFLTARRRKSGSVRFGNPAKRTLAAFPVADFRFDITLCMCVSMLSCNASSCWWLPCAMRCSLTNRRQTKCDILQGKRKRGAMEEEEAAVGRVEAGWPPWYCLIASGLAAACTYRHVQPKQVSLCRPKPAQQPIGTALEAAGNGVAVPGAQPLGDPVWLPGPSLL